MKVAKQNILNLLVDTELAKVMSISNSLKQLGLLK